MERSTCMESSDAGAQITVEVVYALPERQRLIAIMVPPGTTALEAARRSGIAQEFPAIDLATAQMGIFSKPLDGKALPLPQDYILKARDRVEIYRPLMIDPKAARLARAVKLRAKTVRE
jgi:putative ubiquitin-RnfH superfamily antitoxin RatB of RatAB toxin-antitoxin module